MKTPKLNLNEIEKMLLKNAGIRMNEIANYAADELATVLSVPMQRAKSILALIEFQQVPSVGPKFAQDLIDMGYYHLAQLKDKDGAQLLDEHERFIGAWTDPCVEDQFRLVVHYANNPGSKKQWWNFTCERKTYRATVGYPDSRPGKAWHTLTILSD
ncbi:helix-hairpin-helix domain-containing protein [Mucilaginibacter sp. HMF5004]|uniref:helix-hairpin-helix domain-containing protein n=1 Tax=Mucilaginibacter rivuli TaxID=2857527 RepID=UPI001C5F0CCE|nr:helix-hairpin-helix domain-containing protein [Mucilaginibacter rivuli]MBW4891856.1 helix-hairpin-helix domain-containing protein [Mucilaginibacter rivuli]